MTLHLPDLAPGSTLMITYRSEGGPRVESVRGSEFERGQRWTDGKREIELAFQPERGKWETVGKPGQRRTTLSEQTLREKWRRVS